MEPCNYGRSFEYCSPVWASAADCHLALLNSTLARIKVLIPDLEIDLTHRRNVASGCMFFKIVNYSRHPVHKLLPRHYIPSRITRLSISMNSKAFDLDSIKSRTFHHQRSFLPSMARMWNRLSNDIVECTKVQKFKEKINKCLKTLNLDSIYV